MPDKKLSNKVEGRLESAIHHVQINLQTKINKKLRDEIFTKYGKKELIDHLKTKQLRLLISKMVLKQEALKLHASKSGKKSYKLDPTKFDAMLKKSRTITEDERKTIDAFLANKANT